MNRITLHRASGDNAGHFCDAGETLTIGDARAPGTISADAAQALVDSDGAVDAGDTEPKPELTAAPTPEPLPDLVLDPSVEIVDDEHHD